MKAFGSETLPCSLVAYLRQMAAATCRAGNTASDSGLHQGKLRVLKKAILLVWPLMKTDLTPLLKLTPVGLFKGSHSIVFQCFILYPQI